MSNWKKRYATEDMPTVPGKLDEWRAKNRPDEPLQAEAFPLPGLRCEHRRDDGTLCDAHVYGQDVGQEPRCWWHGGFAPWGDQQLTPEEQEVTPPQYREIPGLGAVPLIPHKHVFKPTLPPSALEQDTQGNQDYTRLNKNLRFLDENQFDEAKAKAGYPSTYLGAKMTNNWIPDMFGVHTAERPTCECRYLGPLGGYDVCQLEAAGRDPHVQDRIATDADYDGEHWTPSYEVGCHACGTTHCKVKNVPAEQLPDRYEENPDGVTLDELIELMRTQPPAGNPVPSPQDWARVFRNTYPDTKGRRGSKEFNSIRNAATSCTTCGGKRSIKEDGKSVPCPTCKGEGDIKNASFSATAGMEEIHKQLDKIRERADALGEEARQDPELQERLQNVLRNVTTHARDTSDHMKAISDVLRLRLNDLPEILRDDD